MWAKLDSMRRLLHLGVGLGTVLALALAQQGISGRATVIDGDRLKVGEESVQLWGIDAVELSQECLDSNRNPWPCGVRAAQALRSLIGQRPLSCEVKGSTPDAFVLAVCRVGNIEINRWMVEQGWALAFLEYGGAAYIVYQADAQLAERNIWQGWFQKPWDYRSQPIKPQPGPAPPPRGTYYANCDEARAAGAAPIYRGQPGYRPELDADNDGVACERY